MALVSEWFFWSAHPLLYLSTSSLKNEPYWNVVLTNYGPRSGHLVGASVLMRFANEKCGNRGNVTLKLHTANVNGIYLARFARTPVAFVVHEWDLSSLDSAVEDRLDKSSECGPERAKYLASAQLSCVISLKGSYGRYMGAPAFDVADSLVPCDGFVGQLPIGR